MTYKRTKWTPSRNAPLNVDGLNKIEDELETLSNAAYTGGVGTQGPIGLQGAKGTRGLTGVQGSIGIQGPIGSSPAINWFHYIGSTQYQSTAIITSGSVLTYLYEGDTVYRHITTAVTGLYPTEDAFYSGFDGTTLSTLIVSR